MDSNNPKQSPSTTIKPLKPRKFRSSCDACSASKVKCGQEQPQCIRCVNLGLRCHYSESRRMGKPPASSRKLTNTSTTSSKTSNPSSSDSEQINPSKKRQLSPPSYIASPPLPDQPIFETTLMDTDNFMAIDWQDDLFQQSDFTVPNTADMQMGNANMFDMNFDFMADTTMPTMPLPSHNSFLFGDEVSSLDSSRVPTPAPIQQPKFENFTNFATPMQSSPSLSSTISPRTRSSSAVKPKLCTHNLDLGSITSPSPISHNNASIDQVLIKNKAAIEKADALLACSCSSNPHFALTLALTCIKILGTYEDIIKAVPVSSISPATGLRRSGPVQISVGAYKMDAEDEERMRIQIVVNEMRKVRALVDKYAKKYCALPDASGDGIYSALEVFLRSKLTNTMHDLVTRLELTCAF